MQPVEGFTQSASDAAGPGRRRDWVIEPWIPAPPEFVVYEYGARLDEHSQACAREQLAKARALYNRLVVFIRALHAEMNAWVLAQAGSEAQGVAARLRACQVEVDWLDVWVAEDRKLWQGALLTARRARGRRKGFYRRVALELARRHTAVTIKPLNVKAASRASMFGGVWSDFTRHARAGRAVVALHEFEQAIRWA